MSPTNYGADIQKHEFHDELVTLVRKSKNGDILMEAGDDHTRTGKPDTSVACLNERCALAAQQRENGGRLLQFRASNQLFLSRTNSDTVRVAQQYDALTRQSAVTHRWRGSIQNRRSYWTAYV